MTWERYPFCLQQNTQPFAEYCVVTVPNLARRRTRPTSRFRVSLPCHFLNAPKGSKQKNLLALTVNVTFGMFFIELVFLSIYESFGKSDSNVSLYCRGIPPMIWDGPRIYENRQRWCRLHFVFLITRDSRHQAFTLIELLVVVAVIAVLASLLLPAVSGAKERAKRVNCLSNLKQMDLSLRMYAHSNKDQFPKVDSGRWAWDVPLPVADAMAQNANPKVFYCPSSGFSDEDNWNLWNYETNQLPNSYRVVGYAMTFPGTATVLFTNQNPSLTPQSVTDTNSGVVFPAWPPSERVLMADATISQPRDADEINRWLNTYFNVKGGYQKVHRTSHLGKNIPLGGNLAMLDGHVEWRKFDTMRARTDPTSSNPVFWW